MIDLRSDTVTRPTAAMKEAMMAAELGDDVFGDDPTVNALQEKFAALVGKEQALYVPSGTMANEICIRAQTEPGDEIIAEGHSHFYFYEGGGPAALAGCQTRFVEGNRGIFTGRQVVRLLRPSDPHFCPARLVVIENTHNGGGGKVWPVEAVADVASACHERGLRVHLDGARLMNACVAAGVSPADYAACVDTISVCFSKGLGAPIGSIVAGDAETMARAYRFRKMFGGGLRQAGLLAAACIYALDHHVDRLAEDHDKAKTFARVIAESPRIRLDPATVETNMVYFDLADDAPSAERLCERLGERGVLMLPVAQRTCRAVTHLDVSADQVRDAAEMVVASVGAEGP
jgi:threonine aldolase